MIRSFRCKETAKLFQLTLSRKFPADIQQLALRKLKMLHRSLTLNDLRIPPSNRLEKLKGSRKEVWSIRINKQWRICFRWNDGDAYDVEILDYH